MFPGSTNRKEMARLLALSQVGFEMVAPIGLGLALDYYLAWGHWGVVVGVILGLGAGLFRLVRLATAEDEEPPAPANDQRREGA